MSIKPVIAGNWKMNLDVESAKDLASSLSNVDTQSAEVVLCPSFVHLSSVIHSLSDSVVSVGSQNLYYEGNGAFTGEVSAEMLVDLGCKYVILGHSERRELLNETDEVVNQKIKQAIKYQLKPIVCVGETLEQRESGQTFEGIKNQLNLSLDSIDLNQVIIAYEPIWAIGTGKVASPEQAEEVHSMIRDHIQNNEVPILYGGSVKPNNAKDLLSQNNINGALVGGASLDADSFIQIIQFA